MAEKEKAGSLYDPRLARSSISSEAVAEDRETEAGIRTKSRGHRRHQGRKQRVYRNVAGKHNCTAPVSTGSSLSGSFTNSCVETTVRMAGNLGYDTYVVHDCCATTNRLGPDGADYDPEVVHKMSITNLHGEFCTAISVTDAIALLDVDATYLSRAQRKRVSSNMNKTADICPVTFGVSSMVAPLRKVAMRTPGKAMLNAKPDEWHYGKDLVPEELHAQYQDFVRLIEQSGSEICWIEGADDGLADSAFTYDPHLLAR